MLGYFSSKFCVNRSAFPAEAARSIQLKFRSQEPIIRLAQFVHAREEAAHVDKDSFRAHKGGVSDEIVPDANNRYDMILPVAAVGVAAFALMALFEFLRRQLIPGVVELRLDLAAIVFGAVLMAGVTYLTRLELINKTRAIEHERDLLRTVTDGLPAGVFAQGSRTALLRDGEPEVQAEYKG